MSNERLAIAIVVPRYGREVGGGAERLAREYALRLADRFEFQSSKKLDSSTSVCQFL